MTESTVRVTAAGVRNALRDRSIDSVPPERPALAALSGVIIDVALSLLLGVLLVRDTPLLPSGADGWLVAGLILLPGVAQRVWFALRWPGDLAPSDRKLWLKVVALVLTLVVARAGIAAGIPPSVASGAIATRLIGLTSSPAMRRPGFVGGLVAGLVVATVVLGVIGKFETTLLSGSAPGIGPAVRDLLSLLAVVALFGIIGAQARRQSEEQGRIDQALAAERARIARELHDVVAHQMTGVILQAQGATAVLETDPSRAGAALRSIEEGARAALVEMRRLLGVLREDEEAAGAAVVDEARGAPQPTLDDITALVRAYTRSTASTADGDDDEEFDPAELLERPLGDTSKRTVVRINISDGAETAPPGVQASAHRIVQEAFTNIARHVGRASVDVRIHRTGDDLVVRVINGPSVAPPSAEITGAGLGLRGMRERAGSLGGTFHAGPTDDGWEVRATLPFERTPERNPATAPAGQTPTP